jgi:hypothetical protein
MGRVEKKKITHLLNVLESACQKALIDSIEHTPASYQILVVFPRRQEQHTRELLKEHIKQTYRDIVRVETSSPRSILIEYEI